MLEGSTNSCCDSSPFMNRLRMWSYFVYVLEVVAYFPSLSLSAWINIEWFHCIRPKRHHHMHQLVMLIWRRIIFHVATSPRLALQLVLTVNSGVGVWWCVVTRCDKFTVTDLCKNRIQGLPILLLSFIFTQMVRCMPGSLISRFVPGCSHICPHVPIFPMFVFSLNKSIFNFPTNAVPPTSQP